MKIMRCISLERKNAFLMLELTYRFRNIFYMTKIFYVIMDCDFIDHTPMKNALEILISGAISLCLNYYSNIIPLSIHKFIF